jgi:hypothetical protein
MISNEKVVNCKVIDLVKYYDFDVDFILFDIVNYYKSDKKTYWIFVQVNYLKLKIENCNLSLFGLYNLI